MKRRSPAFRYLAFIWAALQIATPGLSAVADGLLARDASGAPTTHVEATTRATCPVVHSPDCAVCRYLAIGAIGHSGAAVVLFATARLEHAATSVLPALSAPAFGLHSRAPPALLS